MTTRLSVTHSTSYRYASDVVASYNEARISPMTTPEQVVLQSTVEIVPAVRPFRYWDYWGTVVYAFDIHEPHRELTVTGRSVVEVHRSTEAPVDPSWRMLRDGAVVDRFAELLGPTAYVTADDELIDQARRLAAGRAPCEAVEAAVAWVRETLVYEPGATGVHTSALEARRGGRGVCQDFAHLTLAVLRGMGVPSRYASGYLHTEPAAAPGEVVAGESHAWVEAWLGEWWPYDPTNGVPVGSHHVLVARGRDYADVSPLKGVYRGGKADHLGVAVEITTLR